MRTLRTPEERFAQLPEFDLPPRYAEVADGDGDPITASMEPVLRRSIPGAVVAGFAGEVR